MSNVVPSLQYLIAKSNVIIDLINEKKSKLLLELVTERAVEESVNRRQYSPPS